MRSKLFTSGVILAVALVMVTGLAGCAKPAESRQVEPTGAVEVEPTLALAAQAPSVVPGTTVVSAVTPATGTEVQPSMGSAAETPTVDQTPQVDILATPEAVASEPAAAPPPAPAPAGKTVWHTVQRGETLATIARRYGTTVQAIANANGLSNPNVIYVGQKLKIPASGESGSGSSSGGTSGCRIRHTVKAGEWIWQIARNYGVSPYDILAANGLTVQSGSNLQPGRVLCIP